MFFVGFDSDDSLDDVDFLYLYFQFGKKHLQEVDEFLFRQDIVGKQRPQAFDNSSLQKFITVEFLDLILQQLNDLIQISAIAYFLHKSFIKLLESSNADVMQFDVIDFINLLEQQLVDLSVTTKLIILRDQFLQAQNQGALVLKDSCLFDFFNQKGNQVESIVLV